MRVAKNKELVLNSTRCYFLVTGFREKKLVMDWQVAASLASASALLFFFGGSTDFFAICVANDSEGEVFGDSMLVN